MQTCKYCGEKIKGDKGHHMAAHVRHYCKVKQSVRAGVSSNVLPVPFSSICPIMLINSLEVGVIQHEIQVSKQLTKALEALLVVAKANDDKVEPVSPTQGFA